MSRRRRGLTSPGVAVIGAAVLLLSPGLKSVRADGTRECPGAMKVDGGDGRPAGAYVHGLTGPVAIVSGRVAAKLLQIAPTLEKYPAAHRGEDIEFDAQLLALRAAARHYTANACSAAGSDSGSEVALTMPAARGFTSLVGTAEAARLLDVSDRAVRLAITRGRLRAARCGGSWQLDRDDIAAYAAKRKTD